MCAYFNSPQFCKNFTEWLINLLRYFLEPLIYFFTPVYVCGCVHVCAYACMCVCLHTDVHLVLEMKDIQKEAR